MPDLVKAQRAFAAGLIILLMIGMHPPAAHPGDPTPSWTRGGACRITAANLQKDLAADAGWLLVDIRPGSAFAKAHIPGALNLSAHALDAKPFLKGRRVVVMNAGFEVTPLEAACQELVAAGITACILEGGLSAWYAAAGNLAGDPFDHQALGRIPPLSLFRERLRSDHLIIDISDDPHPEIRKHFPRAGHYPVLKASGTAVASLQKRLQANPDIRRLVVVNADGKSYARARQVFDRSGISSLFFLEGGWNGYARFLSDTALMQVPRGERMLSLSRCPPCRESDGALSAD